MVYKLSHHLVKKKKYRDMYTYVHRLSGSFPEMVTVLASTGEEQEN